MVVVLIVAGLQVPVMPLLDTDGNAGAIVPWHNVPGAVKAGVMEDVTVTVNVLVEAHCPASGVNVYVVVALLFNAGLQVPVIPLSDVVGRGANAAPAHIAATGLKEGTMDVVIVIFSVVTAVAHCPFAGVNV